MQQAFLQVPAKVLAVPFAAGTGLMMGVLQACGKGLASNVLSLVKGLAFVPCVPVGSMLFAADGVIVALLAAEAASFIVALGLMVASFRPSTAPHAIVEKP